MIRSPITAAMANGLYDALVEYAGAIDADDLRQRFVFEFSQRASPTNEYRFQGALGFGGKFRYPQLTVDCYPEDLTPARNTMIQETNLALARIASRSDPLAG
ncbi:MULTISPECIES: hypothetical protein [Herbaspirillum]|uniref:Uncharacterized protein n=2 Tax=Herbaspirillum huttiense TaxID=863372 RepID=A0AAJ2LWU8_9BURK|nr:MULTISPECIES: hypothetical protein [Herbaspirillum]MDR9839675.1 hypothetical protein [Herbaspirillum huttiense]